jgi:hypothetical protein
VALDRYGPRRVQSVLLLVAAMGWLLFASADSVAGLMLGRTLIGVGVAIALMADLKAIVLWVPPERVALADAGMIMLGALGAVTATAPAEILIEYLGWRGLFLLPGLALRGVGARHLCGCPGGEHTTAACGSAAARPPSDLHGLRFWRIAPLSAMTSYVLLHSGSLAHVESREHAQVVAHLFAMAMALSVGALLLAFSLIGFGARRLTANSACGYGRRRRPPRTTCDHHARPYPGLQRLNHKSRWRGQQRF